MAGASLTIQDRMVLLKIAREAVEAAARRQHLAQLDLNDYSPALREIETAFVTLTVKERLRGCIGGLEATQPLALDVQEHAAAAAVEDYRFAPVRPEEVNGLHIEISRLTPPVRLDYETPEQLSQLLRPDIDGVILRDGRRRATFLPQVWENLSRPDEFLTHLCQKMDAPGDLWKRKHLEVSIYQVEAFEEE